VVAPAPTRRAAANFRPEVTIAGEHTRVLVEQMLAVGRRSGRLTA
jgi:hypothetical protein